MSAGDPPELFQASGPDAAPDDAELTATRLQEEIAHLNLANLKLEKHVHVTTETMNAMLLELEAQKNQLREAMLSQKALSTFVQRMLDTMDTLLILVGTDGKVQRHNSKAAEELGYDEAEFARICVDDLLHPMDLERMAAALSVPPWPVHSILLETVRANHGYAAEHLLLNRRDGAYREYLLRGSLLYSEQGKFEGTVISAANTSLLRRQQIRLKLLVRIFEASPEAYAICDSSGTILYVNPAFAELSGYDSGEIVGKHAKILQAGCQIPRAGEDIFPSLKEKGYWRGLLSERHRRSGDCRHLLTLYADRDGQGQARHYVGIACPADAEIPLETVLSALTEYDPLTLLQNRQAFLRRAERETRMAEAAAKRLALFYIDLDSFDKINAAFGRDIGDFLLQSASAGLQDSVRKSDCVTRLGGDAFAVLLTNIADPMAVANVAARIIREIHIPVPIGGQQVSMSVGIGVALFPDDGATAEELLASAKTAARQAKSKGYGSFQYLNPAYDMEAHQMLEIETRLESAVKNGEFEIYYQPKVDAALHRIVGAEALIRWPQAGGGMIPPSKFVPIAEENGAIVSLGWWILHRVLRDLRECEELAGIGSVAINLSAKQILADAFVSDLERALQAAQVPVERIQLEITETSIMLDLDEAAARLKAINALGLSIAMDDFGTGYSSLSYLQKMPIQTLKIDRSFIVDYAAENPRKAEIEALVRTIVALGKALNMTIIAEGVETLEQLELLRALGCDEIQGYYFSRPLPIEEFKRFCRRFAGHLS